MGPYRVYVNIMTLDGVGHTRKTDHRAEDWSSELQGWKLESQFNLGAHESISQNQAPINTLDPEAGVSVPGQQCS